MSAKKAYGRPQIHLPEVPVEIWSDILRYATATPDSLICPELSLDLSLGRLKLTLHTVRRYKEALVTKRYVVRVCRQWYALAIPFLYEHVMVFKAQRFEALLETLESERSVVAEEIGALKRLGDLIKRMDILFEQNFGGRILQDARTTLLRICRSTPKLVVLITPSPPGELDALFSDETVVPHLQYLYAHDHGAIMAIMPLKFIASHHSLRFYSPPRFEMPTQQESHGIFASIQELFIPFFPSYHMHNFIQSLTTGFPAGTFPNLHTIVFTTRTSDEEVDLFLAKHGMSLRTIHLWVGLPAAWFSRTDFEILKKRCPVLQEILYSVAAMSMAIEKNDQPDPMPGITTVGFNPMAHQLNKSERRAFFDGILSWTSTIFPNARTIRIISETMVLHLRRCHGKPFDKFLETCSSLGIRVEDHFREPLNSPSLVTDRPMDTEPIAGDTSG